MLYYQYIVEQEVKHMKLEQLDRNFILTGRGEATNEMQFFSIPHPAFDLYGVYYDAKRCEFRRMPAEIADHVNKGVSFFSNHTSGGRLRFSTNSSKFFLRVAYDELRPMSHMPLLGQGGFVLLVETEKGSELVKILPPSIDDQKGYSYVIDLSGELRSYTLYFPLYNQVKTLDVGISEGAILEKGKEYRAEKPILYYGSSITQGGCVSRPDNAYQAMISKWNNIDFINLGFNGNALGEDAMVDYLASVDCSLFVCDYDHNAPDPEHLEKTHFRLYERYRQARPNTPILFLSRPDFHGKETDIERERLIEKTYTVAREKGDTQVYFLPGKSYFEIDRDFCTVDGTHPNDLGAYRMATDIYQKMGEISPKFL